ncbi:MULTISPECIES: lactonase family protein [Enterococcus]|uniref:6-phosphogluconolactonase n=1 Tax=Enterococcus thailandicus TaxID=417368 RepID=A0A179ESD6_ENTTH|nr:MULTISPECIES: lactonase family protein [Enterococcus]MDA3965108.1 lactonase family protein [Enterococcus thailandicus]MDK4352646.1 lactonase family protein [Enterococcus thailandicus]MDT2734900.1 lactonase family protein [Enterococcus thailandicus]MDT2751885.1 lactonase family protein [Enterococcus thailandicus]MDT2776026.1 lactonase family protein [Enterococcus thailandicus]
MIEKIILGTYTRRVSEGIYTIDLDTEKKELSGLTLATKEVSPTYLAKSKAENLYTVTTVDGLGGAGAYDSTYQFLNAVTEEGAPLCYVAVDETRQLVYGANYHKGEVNVYRILDNGGIEAVESLYHQEETGPHKNQDHAHVHYTDLTPDQRLVVCDLGTDRVYTYDVAENGKLTLAATFVAEPGTGPRHLVFHPTQPIAYLFGELDSTVSVLAYQENGSFEKLQKISTLPEDFTGENGGAAIRISNDGRFLYTSNRGHNSIAVFEISSNGEQLSAIQNISTEGDFPRDFALNSTNEFLVCANQNSDNLTLFTRDAQTGKLTLLQKDIYAPECVCVYFD